MARPKTDFPPAESILALVDDQGRLSVRVTPGARGEGISIADGKVLVKVRARPTDGAANAAVRDLLAKALECPPSGLELLRGATSREKVFRVP